jgi:hypothetical protein
MVELRAIEENDTDYRFIPRKPSRRTLRQWWTWLLFKVGYHKPSYPSSYGCHVCSEHGDENTVLHYGASEYDYRASCEFGGNQTVWMEEHQCENCGTVYEFWNGSC